MTDNGEHNGHANEGHAGDQKTGHSNGPPAPLVVLGRRWSDQVSTAESREGGPLDILRALRRRKWTILTTLVVTAAALWAAFPLTVPAEGICFLAVKKPSQMFVPVGQAGTSSGAAVSLLEGQTYKDLAEGVAFTTKVAGVLAEKGVVMDVAEVSQRLRPEFRDPDLLRLKARHPKPSVAILLANSACQVLTDMNQTELRRELEAEVDAVSRLLRGADEQVARSQRALRAFMLQEGLMNVDLNSGSSEIFRSLEMLTQHELARAGDQAALHAARQQFTELQTLHDTTGTPPAAVEDPVVAALQSQIEAVRVKLWDAQKQFTDAHPTVKDLRAHLGQLQGELAGHLTDVRHGGGPRSVTARSAEHDGVIRQRIADVRREILKHEAQIATRTRLIDEQRHVLRPVPAQRAELERLKLGLAFAEERYRTLSKRLDETRVNLDAMQGTISIVQSAVTPEVPSSQRRLLVAALLLLGLPIGVGLLVDYLDPSIRNPATFSRQLGLPCLATVPRSHSLRRTRSLGGASLPRPLQAFQMLRSSLRLTVGDTPPRTIAIVGSTSREGRSTVVLHLARTLSAEGKRVIIVDADLRGARLARRLRVETVAGLAEVLTGECELEDTLEQVPSFNAVLLAARAEGRLVPPNSHQLFRGPRFKWIVEELSRRADVVLFDTAPILGCADTIELLRCMDGVIFVAAARNATPDGLQHSLDLVRSSGARNLGVVLNKI